MTDSSALDPEDRKIVTLARSARARNGVPEGAAVRDLGGPGTPVLLAGLDGVVRRTVTAG